MRKTDRLPAALLAALEVLLALGLALLVVIVLSAAAVALAVALDGGGPPDPAAVEGLLLEWIGLLLLVQAAVFIAFGGVLILLRTTPGAWPRRSGAVISMLAGLAAALVTFALSHGLAAVQDRLGFPVQEQDWVLELAGDPARLARLAPFLVLLAPLAEEVFLRGYVFRFLYERAGPGAAYGISSVLFALIHFNPSGFAIYVAIGLVLAWIYRKSGNLLAPIAGHVCFNALVIAALAWGAPPG